MSNLAIRVLPAFSFRQLDLDALGAAFFRWWAGLYAEAPRRLRPMI